MAMLAANRRALYVGNATHGETLTSVPLPAGARAGDLAVVNYLAGRTISGGSGHAWTVRPTTGSMMGVAFKLLEAADLTNAINFNDVTNVVTQVVRGPRSLSTERTGVHYNGLGSQLVSGFVKSAVCMGLYSAAYAEFDNPSVLSSGALDPFNADTSSVGPSAFSLQARVGVTPARYVDNDGFVSSSAIGGGDKGAGVFEFLF